MRQPELPLFAAARTTQCFAQLNQDAAIQEIGSLANTCNLPGQTLLSFFMSDLSPEHLALGFIYYVVFLFSTTCHEAAHALVGKWGGDDTAALGGQVTLNPIPHIRREPWGMVVIPLISFFFVGGMFGWASAPYDPLWERRHPHRAARMALAGPAANFTLMLLGALALRVGSLFHLFGRNLETGAPSFVMTLLFVVVTLNLLLGTFNLLPVPPLDGSTGVMLLMSENKAQGYLDWLRGNSFAMAGLLVGMAVFQYIFPPIQNFAMHLLF